MDETGSTKKWRVMAFMVVPRILILSEDDPDTLVELIDCKPEYGCRKCDKPVKETCEHELTALPLIEKAMKKVYFVTDDN